MLPRPAAARAVRAQYKHLTRRTLTSTPHTSAAEKPNGSKDKIISDASAKVQGPTEPYKRQPPPAREKTWLTRQLEASPALENAFKRVATILGANSPRQISMRHSLIMYERYCATRDQEESKFWHEECGLPPSFQSWFTITNLHVWLLNVRLRSLPPPHGKMYIQALLDHFFLDVEERIRAILQPSSSTIKPVEAGSSPEEKARPKGAAPERLVTRQMKIFREQWGGMHMALDLGLVGWGEVNGDQELAAAVWRNLLGSRGAQGIAFSTGATPTNAEEAPTAEGGHRFRRSVNVVGGAVENVKKLASVPGALEAAEATDDGSGVHDFPPAQVDRYLIYPELMWTVVAYLRREIARMEELSDEEVMSAASRLRFGPVRSNKDSLP